MKRIIYFLSIVLVSALYSCSGQYDNIEQYATDETVYVGKFSNDAYVYVGYKRLEIELFGDSVGRAFSDDLYLGKAKKTVIEYEEEDGLRTIEFDSVCSWVNIKGLTMPKTYVFSVYAEDGHGNRSIPVEVLGKPYTDSDFQGIEFPSPQVIPAPTTVAFDWESEVSEGLSSPLFKFIELIYSYTDIKGNIISGKLTARDAPTFSIKNLKQADSTAVILNCRIVPVAESGLILDTLSMVKEIVTKTATDEEYLANRTLRPIKSAIIDPADKSSATIILGNKTDHLLYTDIRYKDAGGAWQIFEAIPNSETELLCTNIGRREKIQIRCTYNPPETDIVLTSDWTDYGPFIVKSDPREEGWVVIPRHGNHPWGDDGRGSQDLWSGGHPMLILDDDPGSGWHSPESVSLPQVLAIDMKENRRIGQIIVNGGYMKSVEIYLTDNLSIGAYTSHTVNWDDSNRENNYNNWVKSYVSKIPGEVPVSWSYPIAQNGDGTQRLSFFFPEVQEGRFLILRFPDNNIGWQTYIAVHTVEVYSD